MSVDVLIVGAGPSGLVLGLFLAQYQVTSIILEKEFDITADPRGVVLTGDAVRSLWKVGIGKHISYIGQELRFIKFHDGTIQNGPFLDLRLETDMMQHALPSTLLQSQPRLEQVLRNLVHASEFCTLHSGCEVVGREEDSNGVTVHYLDSGRASRQIRAQWLVGADGKRGIVRKHFLEASAGIRQEAGIFEYDGTWIAANLKITLPTRDSHPDLPFWDRGYDSEAVYDLFWPQGWHFCRPPGRPVACGRFGPRSERLWRHEFAVPEWDDSMDFGKMFWEHLIPMITRTVKGADGKAASVTFPRDCIEVLRCRPFGFSHKVVNRWFSGRTVLIGDAAHVFPPFGGQGIAAGVNDADGLAWRLAILVKKEASGTISPASQLSFLQSWAEERRMGVDNSARLTLQNGELCNNEASWAVNLQVVALKLLRLVSRGFTLPFSPSAAVSRGYLGCPQGAFLPESRGGTKLGQIYVQTRTADSDSVSIELSDQVLRRVPTILTLLVLHSPCQQNDQGGVLDLLRQSRIDPDILSPASVVHIDLTAKTEIERHASGTQVSFPAQPHQLIGYPLRPGYSDHQLMNIQKDSWVRYVIVRPDNIVYAQAGTLQDLKNCLKALEVW